MGSAAAVGVVGLVIGYGCNLLNVVRVGKRVLLAVNKAEGMRESPLLAEFYAAVGKQRDAHATFMPDEPGGDLRMQ